MKKIICLLLMLVLCFGMLAACGKDDGDNGDDTGDGSTPVKTTAEEAKDLLFAMYKDDPSTTQADYELVGVIKVGDATCNIVWSVNVTSGVTVGEVKDSMVTVDVDEETGVEIVYVLTATITDPDGKTATVTFNRTVPKFKVNTFEEYIAAKKDDSLVIEGIVVGINSKDAGNKRNHLFIADLEGKGGYYIYDMPKDPVKDYGVEVGMTVRVSGIAAPFGDMQEIKEGAVKILDSNKKDLTAIDISAEFDKTDFDITKYVGALVNIKGVTLGSQELDVATSQYLFFTKGAIKSYVRTYVTDLPTSVKAEDKATIDAFHASKFGYNADVTGILIMYNTDYYLLPVGSEPFTNVTLPERTDAEKIELEAGNVTVTDNVTADSVINLPLTGSTYESVVFTWAVSENACATLKDGVLTVTLPDEATTITLTLTVTCGEATAVTKEFTIKVDAAVSDLYLPVKVETPKKDTAYKFFLAQNTLGANYYFAGKMSGNYLATTTNSAKAVDVYLEEVDGGYLLYFMDGETKKYIEIYEYQEGRVGVQITETKPTTNKYTFNAELGILVSNVAGTDYYLGTYDKITDGVVTNSYYTMSASKLSYISGENASKIGVSQFPSYLATLELKETAPVKVETPKKDTAYKFFLAQNTLGANYYFAGKMSGNYLATTTNSAKAVDVYLEEVDGGYLLYFMDGETKKYIEIYEYQEGRVGVQITETKPTTNKYTFNAELGILVSNVAGTDYYLGTYDKITDGVVTNSYYTMSASKLSYISGENASKIGVSQFPSYLATIEFVDGGDAPEVPDDPDQPGQGGEGGEGGEGGDTGDTGDTPNVPVVPGEPTEDVVKTYIDNTTYSGVSLIVTVNETKKTVYFLHTQPTKTSEATYNYTVAEDGSVTLTNDDGTEVFALMAAITFEDGVATEATWNGNTFYLEVAPEPEVVAVYTGTAENGSVFIVTMNETAGTVTFTFTHPMTGMPVDSEYAYTVVDGAIVLTLLGETVAAEEAFVTLTDGVPTAAGYWGQEFALVPYTEPEEEVITVYESEDGILTVTVNETAGTVTYDFVPPMGAPSSATFNYEIVDGAVVLTNDDGSAVNPLQATLTIVDGVATSAGYNGFDYALTVGGSDEPVIEGTPILVGDTTVNVTEDDITYGALEYVLTVTEAGTYTFTTDFFVQIRDNFGVIGIGTAYLEEGVYNVIIVVEGATAGEYTVNLTYTAPEEEEESISLWDGCEIEVTEDMLDGFTAIYTCWNAGEYDINSSALTIVSVTAEDGTVIEKNANGYYEFASEVTYTIKFSALQTGTATVNVKYQYPAGHQENPIKYASTENIKVIIAGGEDAGYEMVWYYYVATKTGILTLTDISARTDVWLSVTAVKGSDVTNVTYDAEYNAILSKSVSMPVKEGTVCYFGVGVYGMITEDAEYEVTVSIDGEYATDGTANAPHNAVDGENTVTVPQNGSVYYAYTATADGTVVLSTEVAGVYWYASTDISAYFGELSVDVSKGDTVYIYIADDTYTSDIAFVFDVTFEKEETAEDIVNAAYALEANASLSESKTLEGVVVSIEYPYADGYSTISLTIIVSNLYDKPIYCYKLAGDAISTVKIGDTVTVSGTLKNYVNYSGVSTIEFDGCTLDAVDTTATTDETIKVITEVKKTEVKNAVTDDGDVITLPAAGTVYTDVVISWVSDNACAVIADGKVTFTLQAEAQTVKLTATYTVGETTKTVDYVVNVAAKPISVTGTKLATFEFGENVAVTDDAEDHNDGSAISEGEVYTDGTYTLTLTGVSKVYDGANDEMGNSALKLGTSSVVGTFSFTVGEDVDFVIIKVAQYKVKSTKVTVNGEEYTILTASNNGEYTEIKVDTSVNKTVTFSTVSGACRAMVDSIAYWSKD